MGTVSIKALADDLLRVEVTVTITGSCQQLVNGSLWLQEGQITGLPTTSGGSLNPSGLPSTTYTTSDDGTVSGNTWTFNATRVYQPVAANTKSLPVLSTPVVSRTPSVLWSLGPARSSNPSTGLPLSLGNQPSFLHGWSLYLALFLFCWKQRVRSS